MKGTHDLRHGVLWKQILLFALPIAATSMLQQLFNSADVAVVGQFSAQKELALAAVGSTSSIVNLYITIFTGLAVGANVVIARLIGAEEEGEVRKAVHTSLVVAVLCGAVLMVVGECLAGPLLRWMDTPENIIHLARQYLQIYLLGAIFQMVYNFEAAILRANGDTRRPLLCLLLSGGVNVVLNLVFVLLFHIDVAGVALATVIADGVGAGLLWHYLRRETGPIRVEPALLRLDRKLLRGILYIGIPAAIQGMMFNIANVIIQSGINRLGSDVVAASTIGVTAEIFVYYLLNSFGQASMTFNGQNYGAGNLRRCRSATRWCLLLGGILSEAFALLLVVFGLPFAGIYTSDAGIALLALTRMRWVLPFQLFNMVIEVMSGTLRGLGYSFVPTILCAVFVCGLRILWVAFVFPLMPTFQGLLLVYPASWLAAGAAVTVAYWALKRKLLTEKPPQAPVVP